VLILGHRIVHISKQWIAANPPRGIRVFSGQFLHSGGQQMILIGLCPLRKMLRNRNVIPVKKMTGKGVFAALVLSFVSADPQEISHNSE
jgi:hypothetical protein